MRIFTEFEARQRPRCICCANEKTPDALVCWSCFKSYDREDNGFIPLKYYQGTFEQWQKYNQTRTINLEG